jgi:hypothetical protein
MLQGRDDHCGLACKLRPRWRSTDHDHAPIERRWNEIERKFPVYVLPQLSPRNSPVQNRDSLRASGFGDLGVESAHVTRACRLGVKIR